MKKIVSLLGVLVLMMLASATVSAHDWHDERYDESHHWRHIQHNDDAFERGLPFAWHDRFYDMRNRHRLERIHDREWADRFPGLHAYRWYSQEGFWHHGHLVKDAVFFYNERDELVSVGYMADGIFITIRDDHESYENHDHFYFSWFHHS